MTSSPQRYRKIPVEVDAIQWTGNNKDAIEAFTHGKAEVKMVPGPGRGMHEALVIHTLEGDMRASDQDWIIRGVEGESWSCKDSIFRKTYKLDAADECATADGACQAAADAERDLVQARQEATESLSPNAQAFARGGVVEPASSDTEVGAPLPTVGRNVYYQTYGTPGGEHEPETLPAIVVKPHPAGASDLFVIYPNGTAHKQMVPWSAESKPGHWHWPPYVWPGKVR